MGYCKCLNRINSDEQCKQVKGASKTTEISKTKNEKGYFKQWKDIVHNWKEYF